ncbi:MAG: sigma 54-dependent Fis family transcriptional regulator [Deltaproteobacteria bacterium]|nr:sigma 54-dependent Fis family transcriptional regulator [Deltaproteobacteria bacterium]
MTESFGRMATAVVAGESGAQKLVLEKARLKVVAGPDKGKELTIEALPCHIGTHEDNDLQLSDPTVSAHHAAVDLGMPHGFRIRDLGSTNGIVIDRYRVYDAVLAPGMLIRLGATEIKVIPSKERREVQLSARDHFGSLVGASVKMRELYATLERLAGTDSTLLIEGETGTGKELAAESVHAASRRSAGPFVVFDCGAAPPTLLEAELFGNERGAFTGAVTARAGLFEEADGGTIFLDEIGELDLQLQPKLLRVLERREVRRIGASKTQQVDVRVIAATNRSIEAETRAGRFREDLLYRLAVVRVRMPPLRERREDIPMLVESLLERMSPGRPAPALPYGTLELLTAHSWPGNVRELRNVVERLIAMPESLPFEKEVPLASTGDVTQLSAHPLPEARRRAMESFERAYVIEVLGRCNGNVTRAAQDAGVSRQFLTRLIARYRLRGGDE